MLSTPSSSTPSRGRSNAATLRILCPAAATRSRAVAAPQFAHRTPNLQRFDGGILLLQLVPARQDGTGVLAGLGEVKGAEPSQGRDEKVEKLRLAPFLQCSPKDM